MFFSVTHSPAEDNTNKEVVFNSEGLSGLEKQITSSSSNAETSCTTCQSPWKQIGTLYRVGHKDLPLFEEV